MTIYTTPRVLAATPSFICRTGWLGECGCEKWADCGWCSVCDPYGALEVDGPMDPKDNPNLALWQVMYGD